MTAVLAGTSGVLAPTASADVRDGRAIEIFHGRNMVGLNGYPPNTPVTARVFRGESEIGFATLTTDGTGFVEINHVGGSDCWQSQYTPDIRPGDVVRTSVRGEARQDSSATRDVFIRQDAQFLPGNIIRVTGHAKPTANAPIAGGDAVELRLNKVSATNNWETSDPPGRRDLRLEDVRPFLEADGTYAYDFAVSADDWNDARTTGIDISTVYLHGVTETAEATELTFYDGEPEATEGCPATATDSEPPTAPTMNPAQVSGSTVSLSWSGATDNVGVAGYEVSRNGTPVGTVAGETYVDRNVPAGTHSYAVRARDAVGNPSPPSAPVSATVVNTPPTVTARTPGINAVSVGVGNDITATFSEAVRGVTTSSFAIRPTASPGSAPIAGTVTRTATTNQWKLDPGANLRADTNYTVTLTGGAPAIHDLQGAALAPTSWSFTTGPAPTVSARTPAVGATGVGRGSTITATFSEAVRNVGTATFVLRTATGTITTVSATVRRSTTNPRQWILDPNANLAANRQYRVTLDGGNVAGTIRDGAGNPLANDVTWTFTTGA